ncbi:MAG: 23S rRNA (pseudouridine(1915)-N(3))-methyltransferase RlmH [Cellvibrionaceae bacterium]|nr:23S rRNA (pseudouridine(1915)-N(3))-methyltransferase RlmH [Cellvibrionaceae bacterium]
MHIRILAVGTKMPAWIKAGVDDYHKRLPRQWRLDIVELPLAQRTKSQEKSQDMTQAIAQEGHALLKLFGRRHHVVALDLKGKAWDTDYLATQVQGWQMQGQNIDLVIGGPNGLSPAVFDRADQRWSLSNLTLPHPLVRIVVVEQLYRSWSLLNNHPYHK